ncbi:hypothetical protein KAS31_00150 [Candidatus Parcubacteria bacterium]|nr:hypothetical protein [Candidatus Parcubacteria bacterium]
MTSPPADGAKRNQLRGGSNIYIYDKKKDWSREEEKTNSHKTAKRLEIKRLMFEEKAKKKNRK